MYLAGVYSYSIVFILFVLVTVEIGCINIDNSLICLLLTMHASVVDTPYFFYKVYTVSQSSVSHAAISPYT